MASLVFTSPTSPSTFWDENPRSPNSWTARSFTTLQPSDSPSQALFPKHSQASLLRANRTENGHIIPRPHKPPALRKPVNAQSSIKRNFHFLIFGALLHISIIVLTTMLVLILTAATSQPRKHIHPAYYIGAMLSFAASLTSAVAIYVRYNERKRPPASEETFFPATAPTHNNNNIELGHLPSHPPPPTTFHALALDNSNWNGGANESRHPLRSIILTRNPLTTVSARLAGSNNQPRTLLDTDTLPAHGTHHSHNEQQQRDSSGGTAAAIQRFLDHEIQRQDAVKRRISAWLRGITSTPDVRVREPRSSSPAAAAAPSSRRRHRPPLRSPPPPPPPQSSPATPATRERTTEPPTPRDPARLKELEQEIESYLGIPAPPLAGQASPTGDPGLGGRGERRMEGREREVENIDYDLLPPAIPRPGARGRDPMLSDPVTVVWAPENRRRGVGERGAEEEAGGARSGIGAVSARAREAGGDVEMGLGERGKDGYEETRVGKGVDGERGAVIPAGVGEKGKGWRGVRFW
ncbi:MAG: hypothetical protein L6R40_006845 [Gallowayella cf. fulva]|nr:MAG: hypothetical protein L6R40_006845 [Xanthomendoza cf. fulva]